MLFQNYSSVARLEKGPVITGPFLYPALYQQHSHTCWIEINRQRFLSNAYWLKRLIGNNVSIAVVLKSNAYGHGLIEVGSLCEDSPYIDYMAVFLLSDAISLRAQGINKPIIVLGGYDMDLGVSVEQNIDIVVFDWDTAEGVVACARAKGKKISVHVKVDTGLTRLGFSSSETLRVIDFLLMCPYVSVIGIYTHFAESDNQDVSFTQEQLIRMQWILEELKKKAISIPFVHLANTAASLRFPEARGTMIRCGGALYGSYKDERFYKNAKSIVSGFSLKTCFSLKSRVMMVCEVSAGTPIGYARTFKAEKAMKLAVVGVGYYDGYDRRLSNTGKMLIHGKKVSIVGRVGMNMTTIDVSSIPSVKKGDEVLVIGDHDEMRLKDIAQKMGVIEYEVMPPLNPSLSRLIV
jgi:alanine racemase